MLPRAKVIIVDDNEDELKKLAEAFHYSGIPCLPLQYESRDRVKRYGIEKSTDIRWLFIDLHLEPDSGSDTAQLVGPIKEVISHLIKGGIYSLVFWSKHTDKVNAVIERIKRDEDLSNNIPAPLNYACIDKNDFIDDAMRLKEKLKDTLLDNKLVSSMLRWENAVANASSNILTKVHQLAGNNTQWDMESKNENIKHIISLLAHEASGYKVARENANISLNKGLFSLVEDDYSNLTKKDIWSDFEFSSNGQLRKVPSDTKVKLNTYILTEEISLNKNGDALYEKGVISFFDRKNENIKSLLGSVDLDTIIREEFTVVTQKVKLSDVILGVIEISPDCDHANKKIKMHRFILTALVPTELFTDECWVAINKSQHEGVFKEIPDILYKDKKYKVFLSFKYIISIPSLDENKSMFGLEALRLKDDILIKIRTEMARYISRPGYTAIH
ncbi:TPA: hypothetical protein ACXIY6_001199 [Serratia marcescens]|nr:hypothetical protein [Serratia marcescens]MDX7539139.1 hypothetical protein [Serratia marcescens]